MPKPTLDNLIGDLSQLGFDDPDKPVSGADTVDVICTHWDDLRDCRDQMVGLIRANQFWKELLAATETLTAIADEHGARTLTDLMYLHQAILTGSFIDHYPEESAVAEIVGGLPSADEWQGFIKTETVSPTP